MKTLTPAQRMQAIIEALGFGIIRGLLIREGQPCFDPAPRIVQSIKVGSQPGRVPNSGDTIKKAFGDLIDQVSKLHDCSVDIEVQHGRPFRLILERSCEEFD